MSRHDEFYIGYEGRLPPAIRRHVTIAVVAAIVGSLCVGVVFVGRQRPLADSRFEFGQLRAFTGYLALSPAPVLIVSGDPAGPRLHWLVAPGKFGAAAVIGPAQPGWVTLQGTLIEREQWRMIEVAAGTLRPTMTDAPPPRLEETASHAAVLTGEVVDSKCFLGVMNPGERNVHRDCAVRCLSGGVPPMFAYQDDTGSRLALLVSAGAGVRPGDVGRTIRLSGRLSGPEDARVFSVSQAH